MKRISFLFLSGLLAAALIASAGAAGLDRDCDGEVRSSPHPFWEIITYFPEFVTAALSLACPAVFHS